MSLQIMINQSQNGHGNGIYPAIGEMNIGWERRGREGRWKMEDGRWCARQMQQ